MAIQGASRTFLYLFVAITIFFIYLRYIERRSIYFPMREIETTPTVLGLFFEDVFFKTDDQLTLNGWFIPYQAAKETLLFCHGNGGNISHRLQKIEIFHRMGLNLFIFDYRGYGKSQGSPSEKGLYKDGEAAYQYLTAERGLPCDNIILYGESLGAAIAVELASKRTVMTLITEEAFSSMGDMVRIIYPFLPSFVVQSKFDSISKIRTVRIPKLVIHSVDDEIVPFKLGERLFYAASQPKEFLRLRGSHNTAFLDSEEVFESGIASFLGIRR